MTNREYLEKVKGITDLHSFFVGADDLDYPWVLEGYCYSRKSCPIEIALHSEVLTDPCYVCFNEWLDKEHK